MRINKVCLENYRIHEKLEIEFSKGINLLLGENGKGKSSILEAIGYALFDSGLRAGNQKEAIKYGKKSAKIEVNFIGIDNEEYTVVRKIPGTTQLFKGEELLDERAEKIRELCGIKGDIKNIYDNVIVAKQNEFILAFKEKSSEREKIFNKIFNTEIYGKIYENFSKEAGKKYKQEIELLKNTISNISENLLDPKKIKEKLKYLNEELKLKEEAEEILENKTIKLKKELENLRDLELNLSNLEIQKKNLQDTLKNKNIEKNETLNHIAESSKAENIVKENESEYKKYQILSDELNHIKYNQKILNTERDEYFKKEKVKTNYEHELSKIFGEKEILSNNIENHKKNIYEKDERISNLILEKNNKEKEALEYKENLKNLHPILTHALDMENNISKAIKELENYELKISNKIEELNKYIIEKNKLENKNLQIIWNNLINFEKELKEKEKKKEILQTKKLENKEAFNMLNTAICPYLKEKCENLKNKDIDKFFEEKIQIIENELEINNYEINDLQIKLKDKNIIQNDLYRLESLEKIIIEKKLDIEKEKLYLKELEINYLALQNSYLLYKTDNNFKDSQELTKLKLTYETNLSMLEIDKYIKELEKLELEKSEIRKKIEKITLDSINLNDKKLELEKQIQEIKIYLNKKKDIETKFNEINSDIEKREKELKNLEKAKDLYIENYKKSSEKAKYISKLENIENFLENELKNFKKLEILLNEGTESLSKYDKEELNKKEKELALEFGDLRGKIGELKNEICNQEKILIETIKRAELLKENNKKLERLKLKLELTESFRENIKNMGKEISKNMLKEIETLATENFRKITGRGEKITWSNEDKDRYLVYLCGDRGELKFEQLSGGEQVAVAISIRGALSTLFTESNFSIFDEPTNNLDIERKKSLADSIGEILKTLDQSIIVTHDDTFREMAEKVIEI